MENYDYSSFSISDSENDDIPRKDINDVLDQIIFILKKDCSNNKEKASKNEALLKKLKINIDDLPPKKINDIKAVFEDNEVFNFNDVGSSEMVTVNPSHIMESLKTNKHLADLARTKFQFEEMLSMFHRTSEVVQRELDGEKAYADLLNEQTNEKSVLRTKMKIKLGEAQREHEKLEALFEGTEKPRYTLDNLHEMHEEVDRLEEALAVKSTRLQKYNNLPLSEKEALKYLNKIKEEISNVENKIQRIVKSEM